MVVNPNISAVAGDLFVVKEQILGGMCHVQHGLGGPDDDGHLPGFWVRAGRIAVAITEPVNVGRFRYVLVLCDDQVGWIRDVELRRLRPLATSTPSEGYRRCACYS